MPSVRTLARSFNAGEITPEMFGRIDDVKYQTGLALCLNFITTPHGPAVNRPGTAFVRAVKNSAKRTRLIPFAYSTTQTMVIEIGENYMRFHTASATLVVGTPAAWDSGTAYTPGDLVSFGGVNYVSIAAGRGTLPTASRAAAASGRCAKSWRRVCSSCSSTTTSRASGARARQRRHPSSSRARSSPAVASNNWPSPRAAST